MACTSGCPTPGLHQSLGECARSKRLQVADIRAHQYNTGVNRELDAYREAREAGLQPASTRGADVAKAWQITDATGTPFRADA